jgi:hypothetical protein
MTTTTWKIESLECKKQEQGFADVVYTIHWRLYATEGEYTTSIYGSQSVNFDPTNQDYVFTPYEDLTEEVVLGWLKGSIGEEEVSSKEANIIKILNDVMNPTSEIKPLPWV